MKLDSAAETASIAAANSNANWTVSRALRERNGRMPLIVRHRHRRRRRPQPDLEVETALRRCNGLLDEPTRGPKIGVPYGQPGRATGRIGERSIALGVGPRRPRAIGNDNEGAHLVVDVAPECHDAGPVEMHRTRLVLREQLELEPLGSGKGIY